MAIDAFGGDNSPLEVLRGCAAAADELEVQPVLCGDVDVLRRIAHEQGIPLEGMELVHAGGAIPVEADPREIVREYSDCSMATGLSLLSDGGADAFVSAGSTGALVLGASLLVKRISGVKRAALGSIIPTLTGCYIMVDAGANTVCRPDMLMQFGLMGSAYMEKVQGVETPRVGLINIGEERTKGQEMHQEAYELLEKAPIHFAGNIEARQLPLGGCDVAVADGFVGNVSLKLTEGMGKMISVELKSMLMKNMRTKMGALLLKSGLEDFQRRMDYTEYGGAPLMGVEKPVIKAHGSSNANAFKNAMRQAKLCCQNKMIEKIKDSLSRL